MSRARKGFALYSLSFALINWIEATAILLTLGQFSPGWAFRFAAWHALRSITRKAKP